MQLKEIPPYFEKIASTYTTQPGLVNHSTNDGIDKLAFQIDSNAEAYHAYKLKTRADLDLRYCFTSEFSKIRGKVVLFAANLLMRDYPTLFMHEVSNGSLYAKNTGEILSFDKNGELIKEKSKLTAAYVDSFDALAMQVQEDLAVISSSDGTMIAGHIFSPTRWCIADKIGQSFTRVHQPVPDRESKVDTKMITGLLSRGPYTRFGFGIYNDNNLDHLLRDVDSDPQVDANKDLFLRVERQTTIPIPNEEAFLFLIKTYLYDARQLPRANREDLASSIEGMSIATADYKKVLAQRKEIVATLRN